MVEKRSSLLLDKIQKWGQNHPASIYGLVRHLKPIWMKNNFVFVTRFDDVQEVLARDDVFHVPYQVKMEKITAGENFFLGRQNGPEYTRDVSIMRLAMRREDVPTRVAGFVEQTAERIMTAAPGRIDVVAELTQVVPTLWVGDYFGTPGWDQAEFSQAASAMFAYLFYPDDQQLEKEALAAAATTRIYLDQLIAVRKKLRGQGQAPVSDDVIARCLAMQDAGVPGTDDVAIRNNLIGMLIGAIPTTSKCVVLCLDYLLSNPALLVNAQAAARADDNALINQYVLESLRFNCFGPGLLRQCAQDYVLGAGAWRATIIPRGATVFVSLQSAMLDGKKLPAPNAFKLDRPAHSYMHYGYGLHTCAGQHVNQVQIALIVKAVLKRNNLRRASGPAGTMQMQGVFPAHMVLEFD